EEEKERGRASQGGCEEHPAERPTRVAPHRLVRDREQYPGVAANEETEPCTDHPPDRGRQPGHAPRKGRESAHRSAFSERSQERHERKEAKEEQRPGSEAHR